MNITGEDITGGEKRSAVNPKSVRRIPSRIEEMIDKATLTMDEEIHVGPVPAPADKLASLISNRKYIVDEALRQNSKLDKKYASRMLDVLLNRGVDLPTMKRFSILDGSGESVSLAAELCEELGTDEVTTVNAMETLATVCRAVIHWVMVHHSEKCAHSLQESKTPFIAWRLKEAITEVIKHNPVREVEPKGFENDKDVLRFKDNLNVTDLVLWNDAIWLAAIRGCESFAGTPITKDVLKAATPMFWMFEKPITLNPSLYFDVDRRKYECIGFVIMPTMEDFVRIDFPADKAEFVPAEEGSKKGWITLTEDLVKELKEINPNPVSFSRHGFFIASIFLPLDGDISPQVRFLQPLFEGDDIPKHTTLYSIVAAAMKFLTLKYVTKDTVTVSNKELKADRPLFKQVRKGKVDIPPIKVINLRRPEIRTRKEHDGDETPKEKRNWTCHWFVDPHWRQQFYPSLNRHIPIRILTFVKGDLSKPLKPPRQKVYKAVR